MKGACQIQNHPLPPGCPQSGHGKEAARRDRQCMLENLVLISAGLLECIYVGRTTQKFSERIKQHMPKKLRNGDVNVANLREDRCDSAVTKHLKSSHTCIPASDKETFECFHVLTQTGNVLHLEILEAVYIRNLTPSLCQQKNLKAVHLI